MRLIDGKIEYAPRVNPALLLQLYASDAQGIQDDSLADEVGTALYARCEDILAVSKPDVAMCPSCGGWIPREGGKQGVFHCACGYAMPWRAYILSYKNKDLQGSGALPVFVRYLREYATAKQYHEKILAIDRVIHAFHFELQGRNRLCRSAATCVLHGFESDLLQVLDSLAYSPASTHGLLDARREYLSKLARSSSGKLRR